MLDMNNWDRRHLPSLTSFATFEVAAKHLSFTIAASELNVTQAAVSQQIKYLEKALGKQLFIRKHNAIELTTEGSTLLSAISRGLDAISDAVAKLQVNVEAETIVCSATVAVASHWLKPLIDKYAIRKPNVNFVILASDEDDTLRNFEEVDIALICGNERSEAGEEIHFLFPEVVKPVCSPLYFEKFGPFDDLNVLANTNLMHLHQKHWSSAAIGWQPITWKHWFFKAGLDNFSVTPNLVSNNYSLLMKSAVESQGMILGWQHLVQKELDEGSLVIAHEDTLKLDRGNFLKLNSHSRETRIVKEFVDFVLEEQREWQIW